MDLQIKKLNSMMMDDGPLTMEKAFMIKIDTVKIQNIYLKSYNKAQAVLEALMFRDK